MASEADRLTADKVAALAWLNTQYDVRHYDGFKCNYVGAFLAGCEHGRASAQDRYEEGRRAGLSEAETIAENIALAEWNDPNNVNPVATCDAARKVRNAIRALTNPAERRDDGGKEPK